MAYVRPLALVLLLASCDLAMPEPDCLMSSGVRVYGTDRCAPLNCREIAAREVLGWELPADWFVLVQETPSWYSKQHGFWVAGLTSCDDRRITVGSDTAAYGHERIHASHCPNLTAEDYSHEGWGQYTLQLGEINRRCP